MSTLFLMSGYAIDPAFARACDATVTHVLSGTKIMVGPFLGIALVSTLFRGFVFGNSLQMDWAPLAKATWIFFLLLFYQPLVDTLGNGIGSFTEILAPGESAQAAQERSMATAPVVQQAQSGQASEHEVAENSPGAITTAFDLFSNFGLSGIITWLIKGAATMIIRVIMEFIQQFILGFLYVCGPIALTLSIIPAFSSLAMKWLQNLLAVHMWGLSFALLDTLYANFADAAPTQSGGFFAGVVNFFTAGNGNTVNATIFAAQSFAFILLYIMIPYLTSLYIGSTTAQGFIGSMVGAAASVASTAANVAAPGISGGGIAGAIGRTAGFGPDKGGSDGGSSDSGSGGGGSGGGSSEEKSAPPMSGASSSSKVRYQD